MTETDISCRVGDIRRAVTSVALGGIGNTGIREVYQVGNNGNGDEDLTLAPRGQCRRRRCYPIVPPANLRAVTAHGTAQNTTSISWCIAQPCTVITPPLSPTLPLSRRPSHVTSRTRPTSPYLTLESGRARRDGARRGLGTNRLTQQKTGFTSILVAASYPKPAGDETITSKYSACFSRLPPPACQSRAAARV